LIILGIFSLSGCGGGGSSIATTVGNPLAGIYSAGYNRGGGKITVAVGKNNMVTVTIVDDAAGTYTGSGTMRSDKSFNFLKLTGPNGDTLTIEGSLAKSLLVPNVSGRVVGSITFSYDAPLAIGNVSASLFANTYNGTAEMRNFDSWDATAVIDSNGFVTATIMMNGAPVKLRGLIYSDGRVLLRPDDGEKTQYYLKGNCYLFADLGNIFLRGSLSKTKDGREEGTLRLQSPFGPG